MDEGDVSTRVPPLNMTHEERRTLLHCISAGEEYAVEHFGDEEQQRINSLKRKLNFPVMDKNPKQSRSDQ